VAIRGCLLRAAEPTAAVGGVFGWAAEVGSHIRACLLGLPKQQLYGGVCLVKLPTAAAIRGCLFGEAADSSSYTGVFV
nr:hypothetical protein [Tanacetum cinerariifolium]